MGDSHSETLEQTESATAAGERLMAEPLPSETSTPPPSWLNLPGDMWEKILERLPLPAYVKFGAVGSHWFSLQSEHRRRYSPSMPPMFNPPWFIPHRPEEDNVFCYDSFSEHEQRHRRLRFLPTARYLDYQRKRPHRFNHMVVCSVSLPNGWLLLDDWPVMEDIQTCCLTLLNPLTRDQIELPGLGAGFAFHSKAAASCSPNMAVLISVSDVTLDDCDIGLRLFRTDEDHGGYWHRLNPEELGQFPSAFVSIAFWQAKFYCMFMGDGLVVVDPRPKVPEVSLLDMDQSMFPVLHGVDKGLEVANTFLLESNGQLLLVVQLSDRVHYNLYGQLIRKFQVFEADFDWKRWVKVESLGDRAIFVHRELAVSFVATDIGAKSNCIYFVERFIKDWTPWTEFDMDTGATETAYLGGVGLNRIDTTPSLSLVDRTKGKLN